MATKKAVTANDKKNNGATVFYGGTADGKNVTNVLSLETAGYWGRKNVGVVESSNIATTYALSAGNFAKMTAGRYVIMRNCSYLAGTSNTTLQSGAGDFGRRPINWSESARRLHITSWNYATGVATKGGSAGASYDYVNIGTTTHIDHAAHPTRAIPGELTVTDHHLARDATPTNKDYPAKTG